LGLKFCQLAGGDAVQFIRFSVGAPEHLFRQRAKGGGAPGSSILLNQSQRVLARSLLRSGFVFSYVNAPELAPGIFMSKKYQRPTAGQVMSEKL
jgi:hypothetical protein